MYDGFVFAARLGLFMAGWKFLLVLAGICFCKEGNVFNFTHAIMHTDNKVGRRYQHQEGECRGCYGAKYSHGIYKGNGF